jgi:hypothetical protein
MRRFSSIDRCCRLMCLRRLKFVLAVAAPLLTVFSSAHLRSLRLSRENAAALAASATRCRPDAYCNGARRVGKLGLSTGKLTA